MTPPRRSDAIFRAAIALAAAVAVCQASTSGASSAVCCRAVCTAAAAAPAAAAASALPSVTAMSCSDPIGPDAAATDAAVSVSLNWTLAKDLDLGHLSIAASLPQIQDGGGVGTRRSLLLTLKKPCRPLWWGKVSSLRIVYGRSWPSLELAIAGDDDENEATAAASANTSRLEVHGGVQLHSLLLALPSLVELYASEVSLESRPISGLAHLHTLVLSAKSMLAGPEAAKRLPPRLLESLPALQSARLTGGRIASLRSGFITSAPSLRYLYLINCGITDIAADAFNSLSSPAARGSSSSLRHLFIEGNLVDALPGKLFSQLTALSQLRLASNGLRQIAADTFAGLARLELLDLSANRLRWLPRNAFAGLDRLRALNLRSNPLLGNGNGNNNGLLFCPLASLVTLHADAPVDCREFAPHSRVSVLVATESRSRRRVVHCSSALQDKPGDLSWCEREPSRLSPPPPHQQQRQHHPQFSLPLLLIFGAICAAHLVTALVTVALCRRVIASRRGSPTLTPTPTAGYAVDEEDDDDDNHNGNHGGVGRALIPLESDSAAAAAVPVLVSFQPRSSTTAGAVRQLGMDANDELFPREKIRYDFDEGM